jgi:hypothetical protein
MGVWPARVASTPDVEFFSLEFNYLPAIQWVARWLLRNAPLSGIGRARLALTAAAKPCSTGTADADIGDG